MPLPFGRRSALDRQTPSLEAYEGDKALYCSKMSDMADILVNSRFNRVEDDSRTQELMGYMQAAGFIPNIIYTYEMSVPDGKLHIYDGAHRIKAARQLFRNFQLDLPVIIAVKRLAAAQQDEVVIRAEMSAINKRVMVPRQYTGEYADVQEHANLQIQRLATVARTHVEKSWPKVPSPSNAPKIPNVNVHHLEDQLFARMMDLYADDKQALTSAQLETSAEQMTIWINEINAEFKAKLGNRASEHAVTKDCYLFAIAPGPLEQFLDALEAKIRA